MGIKNGLQIFQRSMSNLILKYGYNKFAANCIDDIIIFTTTFEEHLEHLQKMLTLYANKEIFIKLIKCQFAAKSVGYMSFIVEENSIKPLKSSTEAIDKLSAPTDIKSLRGFLGKIIYYKKIINNRALVLYPLYQLLKKMSNGNGEQKNKPLLKK